MTGCNPALHSHSPHLMPRTEWGPVEACPRSPSLVKWSFSVPPPPATGILPQLSWKGLILLFFNSVLPSALQALLDPQECQGSR